MSLQTPSMTGAAGDCCVEGRRRVTHGADAACGWFTPRVPHGETSRRAGCRRSARPVRRAGMRNGALPNGPSYRAHPRLYRSCRLEMSALRSLTEGKQTCRGHAKIDVNDPTRTFSLATAQCQDRVVARTSLNCVTHLNRRLLRESWLIAVQPISFMSRSISVRIRPSARSTPAWPAAAKGQR
jgi:hypothetical protein